MGLSRSGHSSPVLPASEPLPEMAGFVPTPVQKPLAPLPRWACNTIIREWRAQADQRRRCRNQAAIAWGDADQIRCEYAAGTMTMRVLCNAYDVSMQTIRDIIRGKSAR